MPDSPRIRPGVYFIEEAPQFVVEKGTARIISSSGGVDFEMATTAAQFLIGIRRSVKAYEEWASKEQGKTVRLPVGDKFRSD